MAYIATVKVSRVQDSGQWCAQLDSYYCRAWAYGSSPNDALWKLTRHSEMAETYRPYVKEVYRRLVDWELDYAHLHAGVPLTTIIV